MNTTTWRNNKSWNSEFDQFEYFIMTRDAVVGVNKEDSEIVSGYVISSKTGIKHDALIELSKDLVVKELHNDRVEIIEEIPEWFYFEGGFTKEVPN